jgi:hypothetical protein
MLLWQGSVVEIDYYGFVRVFGPYFIEKSLGTFKILIFGFWSFISHPYQGKYFGSVRLVKSLLLNKFIPPVVKTKLLAPC